MKKLLALACVTSALALTSAAHADYAVTVSGNVPAYCTITSGASSTGGGSASAATIALGAIADGAGGVTGGNGSVTLNVSVNSACTYTVKGTGALAGLKAENHQSIPYLVGLVNASTIATSDEVHAASGAGYQLPVTALGAGTAGVGSETVTLGVNVPAVTGTIYGADTYQDVLTISIVAS